MKPENALVARIRKVFDAVPDAWHEKNHGNGFTKRGRPDLEFTCPQLAGRLLAFEVKMPGGQPTRSQVLYHNKLRRAGVPVYVVSDVAEVKTILRQWGVLDAQRST